MTYAEKQLAIAAAILKFPATFTLDMGDRAITRCRINATACYVNDHDQVQLVVESPVTNHDGHVIGWHDVIRESPDVIRECVSMTDADRAAGVGGDTDPRECALCHATIPADDQPFPATPSEDICRACHRGQTHLQADKLAAGDVTPAQLDAARVPVVAMAETQPHPVPTTTTCDLCEEAPGEYRILVANLDGTVRDSTLLCRFCGKRGLSYIGLATALHGEGCTATAHEPR